MEKGQPDSGTQDLVSRSMASKGAQRPPQVWDVPPRIRLRTAHWSARRG